MRQNTYEKLIKLYNLKISKKINKTDIFISDNLLNKYLVKEKYFFAFKFFLGGYKSFKKIFLKYRSLENKFLRNNTLKIISNRYFGMKKKISLQNIKIGFTSNKIIKIINFHKKYKEKKCSVSFEIPEYRLIEKLIENGYKIYSNNRFLLKNKKTLYF